MTNRLKQSLKLTPAKTASKADLSSETLISQNPIQSNLNPEAKPFQPLSCKQEEEESQPQLQPQPQQEPGKMPLQSCQDGIAACHQVSAPVPQIPKEPLVLTAAEQVSLLIEKRASVVKMHQFLQTRVELRAVSIQKFQASFLASSCGIPVAQAKELIGLTSPMLPLIFQDRADAMVDIMQSLHDRPKEDWPEMLEFLDRIGIKPFLKMRLSMIVTGCMNLIKFKPSSMDNMNMMFPEETFRAHKHYHQFWQAEIPMQDFKSAMQCTDQLSALKALFSLTEARLISLSEAMEEMMLACDAKFKRIIALMYNCSQTVEMDTVIMTLKELTKNLCIFAQQLSKVQMAQSANAMILHMPQEVSKVAQELEHQFSTPVGQTRPCNRSWTPWSLRDLWAMWFHPNKMEALDCFVRDNSRLDWRLRKGHCSLPLLWSKEPTLPNLGLIVPAWIPEGQSLSSLKEARKQEEEALLLDSIMTREAKELQQKEEKEAQEAMERELKEAMEDQEGPLPEPSAEIPTPAPEIVPPRARLPSRLFTKLMTLGAMLTVAVAQEASPEATKEDVRVISKQNGILNSKIDLHANQWAGFRSIQLTFSGVSMGILTVFVIIMIVIWCSRLWTKHSIPSYQLQGRSPLLGSGTAMETPFNQNLYYEPTFARLPQQPLTNSGAGGSYVSSLEQMANMRMKQREENTKGGGQNEVTHNPVTGSPKSSKL